MACVAMAPSAVLRRVLFRSDGAGRQRLAAKVAAAEVMFQGSGQAEVSGPQRTFRIAPTQSQIGQLATASVRSAELIACAGSDPAKSDALALFS